MKEALDVLEMADAKMEFAIHFRIGGVVGSSRATCIVGGNPFHLEEKQHE